MEREGVKDALDTRRRHEDAVTIARLRILLGQSRNAESDSKDRNSKSMNTLGSVKQSLERQLPDTCVCLPLVVSPRWENLLANMAFT